MSLPLLAFLYLLGLNPILPLSLLTCHLDIYASWGDTHTNWAPNMEGGTAFGLLLGETEHFGDIYHLSRSWMFSCKPSSDWLPGKTQAMERGGSLDPTQEPGGCPASPGGRPRLPSAPATVLGFESVAWTQLGTLPKGVQNEKKQKQKPTLLQSVG